MGNFGKYKKKYRIAWESLPEFKGWLERNPDDGDCNQEAYCRLCKKSLRAQKTDLEKHSRTKMHRDKASTFVNQDSFESGRNTVISNGSKTVDLKLAVYIATHSSVHTMDHLISILVDHGKKSMLESLHMHRTKCSKLITNVISPALQLDLVTDVGDEPYSLIVDESTDLSEQRYVTICIRYFSSIKIDVVTEFLGIIQIVETTTVALYDRLTGYLNEINVPIKNLIGISTNVVSNLCSKDHSLYTLLKQRVPLPNLQNVRYVRHLLHLCSSKASLVLPSRLEFMVRETRNWFAHNAQTRDHYADLYNPIDDDEAFLNLIQLSITRWVAWEGAVNRILCQWLELKAHFETIPEEEKCYTAILLDGMFQNPANRLYLVFLNSVLRDVNEADVLFQSSHQDVAAEIHETLSSLILSVARRIIKPMFMKKANERFEDIEDALLDSLALQPVDAVDFGIEFTNAAAAYDLPTGVLDEVKGRCRQYLVVLLTELLKRLPSNMSILKASAKLSPRTVLSRVKTINVEDLPIDLLDDLSKIGEIEDQLRKVRAVDWSEIFTVEVMASASAFWSNVLTHKTAGNLQPFRDIARFALKILSLPLGNDVVERVFSIMNGTEIECRDKMSFRMLDAVLRIRMSFHATGKCCTSFEPSTMMYETFNAKMYDTKSPVADDGQGSSTGQDSQPIF